MRRFSYCLALVGCGFYYLTFGRWLSWIFLLGLLVLPAVSLALSIPAIWDLQLSTAGADKLLVGEKGELLLMGSSNFPMPPFHGKIVLRDLRTGEKHLYREETGFVPNHCGGFSVEIEKGRVMDYLGLFVFPVRRKTAGSLLVRPKAVAMENLPETVIAPPLRWKPSLQRLGENHELRPYRPGDSLNTVHWKLSAKTGSLTVRETMEPLRQTACLTMNLWGGPEALDERMGKLLWLGNFLLEKGMQPIILVTTGEGLLRLEPEDEGQLRGAVDTILCAPKSEENVLPEPVGASWHCCLGDSL